MPFNLRKPQAIVAIASLLLVMLIAAACGSNGNSGGSGASSPAAAESASPSASSTVSPSESPSPAANPGTETRVVRDAFGEVEVPANPQRIVILNSSGLDNLLALGVKPIGAPYSISVNANFFAHLAGQTDGIENTGTTDQPNLESIAKLNPDLIIGQRDTHEAVYEDLKRIAPTVLTERVTGDWKGLFRDQADAVNKLGEADRLIGEFEARIAKFKTDMGDKLTNATVTLIRPREDHIRIYTENSYAGDIVKEAGLARPANQQGVSGQHIAITEEQIGDMDADVIISFGRESEAAFFNDKIQTNPLWGTLSAVQNERVHMVNWETWLSGQGIQASNLVLDDLHRFFGAQ
ncbi:ABC transporter substrate-binding protein [Cohnella cellulosilytica]|uniref:ABC transporter substrate-binding protein n=1 Tax=Cohnella cellulosilytica TaxID=986710 RepID=A0ABW2FGR5_9BACL